MTEIKIVFDTNGGVEVSVKGVKGKGCHKLTADLEKSLGVTVSDQPTSEAYQNETIKAGH